ncbi:hypothetical protein ACHAXR_007147 [Thalassiosira sp. AJA248-18]
MFMIAITDDIHYPHDAVKVDPNGGGIDNAEAYWRNFPKGTKSLLSSQSDIWAFILCSSGLFRSDKEYHWNLWRTLHSSCVIAADFLMKKNYDGAFFMIIYNAYVNECLARGYDYVSHWLEQSTYQNEMLLIFSFRNFFNKFSYFHQALESTVSRKGMCAFIVDKLQYSAQVVHRLQEDDSQQTESPAVFHPFGMGDGVVKGELKTIKVTGGFGIATLLMTVYDDTSLKWVFDYIFAHLYKCYSILDGKSKLKLRYFPSPSLEILSKGSRIFFVTCDDKTVSDFGIEEGDVLQLSQGKCMEKVAAKHELTKQEREGESSAKRGRKAKSNSRKPEHEGPIPAKQDVSTDVLRELHSRAVGPVLDELRPKLKLIRQKLNDLALQKDLPKERQPAKACQGKENVSDAILVPKDISFGGKAGKSIYHILVGEPNNLYNTGQLNLKTKGQRLIVLDLHGCSRYKAIGVLRKRLPAWVEEAMKGDYPFVIKVDVICGCGHQVLSELVAQFIRDNDQVANRPKCVL